MSQSLPTIAGAATAPYPTVPSTAAAVVPRWTLGYDCDFTALSSVDLDHTAATVAINGVTWTQVGGTTYLDDLDIVNGSGLVSNHNATAGAFDLEPGSMWFIRVNVATLVPAWSIGKSLVVACVMGDPIGDASSEHGGIFLSCDLSLGTNDWATALGIGSGGSFANEIRSWRQQGTSATSLYTANNVANGYRALSIEWRNNGTSSRLGTASGIGYPDSWSDILGTATTGWQLDLSSTGSLQVGMFSVTTRTDNTFSSTIKRLSIWYDANSTGFDP